MTTVGFMYCTTQWTSQLMAKCCSIGGLIIIEKGHFKIHAVNKFWLCSWADMKLTLTKYQQYGVTLLCHFEDALLYRHLALKSNNCSLFRCEALHFTIRNISWYKDKSLEWANMFTLLTKPVLTVRTTRIADSSLTKTLWTAYYIGYGDRLLYY